MTTVAGVARDGVVYMAGDTMTNVYDRPIREGARKVRRFQAGVDELLLGFCGAGGIPDAIAAAVVFETPQDDDEQGYAYRVAAAVSDAGVAAGFVQDGQLDASLLLGWRGRLWTIANRSAIPHLDGVAAIGSGEGPAIGALDALLAAGFDPAEALVRAVEVGCARDRYSGQPIQVESIPVEQ